MLRFYKYIESFPWGSKFWNIDNLIKIFIMIQASKIRDENKAEPFEQLKHRRSMP